MGYFQTSFFDLETVYDRLNKKDELRKLGEIVDWRGLKELMERVMFDGEENQSNVSGKAGRKHLCGLLMGKILILQSMIDVSDDTMEFFINDRFTFKRFLGLDIAAKSPDSKTIWTWRERIKKANLEKEIFQWFDAQLLQAGFEAKEGQMVDATFVPTHKPTKTNSDSGREINYVFLNTPEDKKTTDEILKGALELEKNVVGFFVEEAVLMAVSKGCEVTSLENAGIDEKLIKKIKKDFESFPQREPDLSSREKRVLGRFLRKKGVLAPLKKNVACQIDEDATFTKKRGKSYHGYKNHVVVDVKHKLIRDFDVTTASAHDSGIFESLLTLPQSKEETDPKADPKDRRIFADSAYKSKESDESLMEKGLEPHICERPYRNKPLTQEQKDKNKERSKVRSRVEHVFGHMNTSMGGLLIHTIGQRRATVKTAFKNLAYNIKRFCCLMKQREKCA